MKEIVTIQVGSYANFVGSHFWNFQDELLGLAGSPDIDPIFKSHNLNMDVLYRTGETHLGTLTYTPRLVSIDFQGSLGSVSRQGTLYNEIPNASFDTLTWTGQVSTHKSEPVRKNLFLQSLYMEESGNMDSRAHESGRSYSQSDHQDKDIVESLENEVQYWTDFSKVHYHPQSLYELIGVWTDIKDFNNYGIGREAFCGGHHAEEVGERLRFFVEECDHPQGIQFIADDSGGFSAVAGEILENIADEYSNIPVLLYSVRSPQSSLNIKNSKKTVFSRLHDSVSFSKLSAYCKLIVPIGLPSPSTSKISKYLCMNNQKHYHTSALYASAMHSMSIPFRMESLGPTSQSSYTCGAVDVNELIRMLAGQACQNMVSVLDVAMPAPALADFQLQQPLVENLHPLTPEVSEDVEDMQALEIITTQGLFGPGGKRATLSEIKDAVHSYYLNSDNRPRFSHLSTSQCPLPIPLPFPSIFADNVGQHGEILNNPGSHSASKGSIEIQSIPMAARLRSSNAVLPFLENRLENLRKFGIARGAMGTEMLRSWGFGKEDVEEMGEALSNMVTALNPASQDSSDSD